MSDVRVTMRHVRAAKLCARGARDWCLRYDFDWLVFLAEGLPAEQVMATGDAIATRVVAMAVQEAARG